MYGPKVPTGRGVSDLWRYFTAPPAMNSVVIYKDGSVVEKAGFDTRELRPEDNIDTFILGGTDYRVEDTSFQYQSLLAAGYTFVALPEQNTYEGTYRDAYTYEWTPETLAYQNAMAAERRQREDEQAYRDRLEQIAALEAEAARLRGLG
jgi:hypothetical protein